MNGNRNEDRPPLVSLFIKGREIARQTLTVRTFYPQFIEMHGPHVSPAMRQSYHYSFQNVSRTPQIADAPLNLVKIYNMFRYMNGRVAKYGVSNGTVNREANFVNGMLTKATEREILERNPLDGLKLLKESKRRDVELLPEQARQLIDALLHPVDCKENMAPIWTLTKNYWQAEYLIKPVTAFKTMWS